MYSETFPHSIEKNKKKVYALNILCFSAWTLCVVSILLLFLKNIEEEMLRLARQEAVVNYQKDKAFRAWGSKHGGVYVPVSEESKPNPYLYDLSERDLVTPSGRQLTLLNPAYMLRQLMDDYSELYGVKSKITSLMPLNPNNAPDAWEITALKTFKEGKTELFEVTELDRQPYLRLIRPITTHAKCLHCHLQEGVGELNGAVSISVPLGNYMAAALEKKQNLFIILGLIWLVGVVVIWVGNRHKQQRMQDQIKYENKIWKQANFDILTGLSNRNFFVDRLNYAMKSAGREKTQLAMLFIDLDNFKNVNDIRGHETGDQLLKEAGRRLTTCVRSADVVSRLGGDEFTIILPEIKGIKSAEQVAKKILASLAKPFQLNGIEAHLSASIGITIFPQDGQDAGTLLQHADTAMYQAKAAGRNTYRYFTWTMNQQAEERAGLESALRRGLREREFVLYYQPILNISGNHLIGAEALIRWEPSAQIQVGPSEFIPLAEETGLIVPLGDWVLQQAAEDLAHWDKIGLKLSSLSVNISSVQFKISNFSDKMLTFLQNNAHLKSRLFLEITESAFMDENETPGKCMNILREQGVRIALDDFGTGYSSLSYLKRFPVDHIKIDRSFVRDVTSDPRDAALCEAIIAMAHHLGLKVVAEGVETEHHWQFLRDSGCDFVQGYYFAKPMPAADFIAFMRENANKNQIVDGFVQLNPWNQSLMFVD